MFANTVGFPLGASTVIPTAGRISVSNFYGSSRLIEFRASSSVFGSRPTIVIPAGTWNVLARVVGGGGGGGGSDAAYGGGAGGVGGAVLVRYTVTNTQSARLRLYVGTGGGGGATQVRSWGGGGGGSSDAVGYFQGIYNGILNGGTGGGAGNAGTSGAGGGGGGASALGWLSNTALTDASEVLIALAGGGGGGGGAGRGSYNSYVPGNGLTVINRPTTTAESNLTTRSGAPDVWSSMGLSYLRPGVASSDGMAWYNMTNFYPPDVDVGGWDGGAGGGGGGGNGVGGGYGNLPNSWFTYYDPESNLTYWNVPYDFYGMGGGQGYNYARPSATGIVMEQLTVSSNGTYNAGYGLGAGTGGTGTTGYCAVKVTNDLSDRVFPG